MRHLSPLELRVLGALREHPRHGVEPLARVVGEQPGIVRSVLRALRRFELVSREGTGLLGAFDTYELTWTGENAYLEWSRQHVEQLPAGVTPIRRRRAARHRGGLFHG